MLDKDLLNLRSFACTLLLVLLASIEKLWFPFKDTLELSLPIETEVEESLVPIFISGEVIFVVLDCKVVVGVEVPLTFLPIVMALVVVIPIFTSVDSIVDVLPFIVVDLLLVSTLNTSVILLSVLFFSTEKVVSFI